MAEEILEMRIDSLEEQVESLQKKLEIATKALNRVYHDMKCWTFISKRGIRVLSVICEALKEIDLVGTSAKED